MKKLLFLHMLIIGSMNSYSFGESNTGTSFQESSKRERQTFGNLLSVVSILFDSHVVERLLCLKCRE